MIEEIIKYILMIIGWLTVVGVVYKSLD